MRKAIIVLLAMFGGFGLPAGTALSSVIEGPVVSPVNQHTYYLLDSSTWTAAESEAVLMGGHLVTIRNQAEQDWVYQTFGMDRVLWIGLNDVLQGGDYVWVSGEPVTYTNWNAGEPNSYHPGEDYVLMYSDVDANLAGKWNDDRDFQTYFGVVEIVPEVSSAGTLFVLLGLYTHRKKM